MKKSEVRRIAQQMTQDLTDAGKIIEGGWAGFRLAVVPDEASKTQVDEMRKAFFAGAEHLFQSILAVLDSDREPTERDLRRMSLIDAELREFRKQFEQQHPIRRGY